VSSRHEIDLLDIDMSQILVIDDSEFDRRMITRAMKSTGEDLTFQELARGESAIETMKNFKPDVVLLDIRMPGIGGFEVLSRIKKRDEFSECKVIMVSGSHAAEDRTRAKMRGATAFYTKPHTKSDYETMAREIHGLYLSAAA